MIEIRPEKMTVTTTIYGGSSEAQALHELKRLAANFGCRIDTVLTGKKTAITPRGSVFRVIEGGRK